MKIHEYQAKNILKQYDIPIQDGYTLDDINDAFLASLIDYSPNLTTIHLGLHSHYKIGILNFPILIFLFFFLMN